ncbi:ankyrin containing protein [Clostridium sp. CAG:1219]|nr:ankyrin containing protein [Clostridium sp. CAG:1219]
MEASENGHIEVVKVLLAYGANVRSRNDEALIIAAQGDHRDVVKLLLEQYINNCFAV